MYKNLSQEYIIVYGDLFPTKLNPQAITCVPFNVNCSNLDPLKSEATALQTQQVHALLFRDIGGKATNNNNNTNPTL